MGDTTVDAVERPRRAAPPPNLRQEPAESAGICRKNGRRPLTERQAVTAVLLVLLAVAGAASLDAGGRGVR